MTLWMKAFFKDKIVLNELISNNTPLNAITLGNALSELMDKHDLPNPIVTQINVDNLNNFNHLKFTQRDFLEKIPFDYMEVSNIPK